MPDEEDLASALFARLQSAGLETAPASYPLQKRQATNHVSAQRRLARLVQNPTRSSASAFRFAAGM